jgi:hypothetical protein
LDRTQIIRPNVLALANDTRTVSRFAEIDRTVFSAGREQMQLRKLASQDFVNKNLERIAHALVAKARIYFTKLEARQVHDFPFAAAPENWLSGWFGTAGEINRFAA